MNKEDFCHLHLHSEYSQLDGFGSATNYAKKAVANGQQFLACTDHGNIDGLIKFQKACDQAGIKPILGCEGYLVNEWKKKAIRGHISLWVKNNTGFRNLCKMLTIANLEGYYYKPRIDFKTLMKYRRGLVIGTACAGSFLKVEGGIDFFHKLRKRMKDDIYLEVMPHDIKIQAKHNRNMLRLAKETGTKVIVTNDCHYIDRSDWKVHEVLLAIQRKATWNDPKRWSFDFHGLHLRKTKEMIQAMKSVGIYDENFLTNTLEIAEKCSDFRIPKRDIKLPHVPGIDPDKEDKTLWQLCVDGYRERFHRSISHNAEYKQRLKMEYNLIVDKKFTRYFLIVWELCSWCRKQGILIGPGRGSVGGSLMAYLLGITSVDPIKHNLIFDRFINKDRIDYPDIDIDFEDTKRHLIKEHLEELYGEGNISGVSSFNRMKAKAAVKDVARVFEVSEGEANSFTKMVDDKFPGTEAEKIQNAIDEHQVCQEFAENHPRIIKYAKQLAGQVKNYGKHAAAIIVSMQEIGKSGRCVLIDTKKGRNINWEKDDTEFVGLMKLDSLGLKLLSILSHAVELIKQNHNKNIELDLLELENPQVLKEVNEGNTVGAFQINTWAMTNLIKDMGVEKFNHIAHAISLVRPGPTESGMTDNYIKRKHGEEWDRMHHVYEELTSDTYGLLVFQEQVMAVINKVAGLPYETADKIRKIIGKKRDVKEFKKFERKFMRGCRKTKIFSEREATQFWTGLQKWSRYGFNKCLTGDMVLEKSSGNQYSPRFISVEKLYNDWNSNTPVGKKYREYGLDILQKHKDNRIRPGKVIGVYYNGYKQVFEVKTESGKLFKGTNIHRLETFNGFKKIKDLDIKKDKLSVKCIKQKTITERKGQKWKKTYNGCGFQNGKNNIAYIDGRTKIFKRSKKIVVKRSKGLCEKCGVKFNKKLHFEFAHIKLLNEFNGNYRLYHSSKNLLYLCNSCHKKFDIKKGERKKRFEVGYPIYYDKIISIKNVGFDHVYDIEMEGPFHNFIANDIVSHNSHAVEYAILGMWCMWLKHYFPTEFVCASLTYGAKEKKKELVEEAYRLGLVMRLPKVGISHATKWVARDNMLFIPFVEVKGLGPVKAVEASKGAGIGEEDPGITKFFNKKQDKTKVDKIQKHPGDLGKKLDAIKAYDPTDITITDEMREYFDFRVVSNPKENYRNLYDLFGGSIRLDRLDDTLNGDSRELKRLAGNGLKRSKFKKYEYCDLQSCTACQLRDECHRPVMPSPGKYNIALVGEAPGPKEDQYGWGFYEEAPAGGLLWGDINRKGYERTLFHVTNVNKCYPSKSRKPSPKQIQECTSRYLDDELKQIKPVLILAFGNTSLQFFEGIKSGITGMSGRTTWNEKYGCWIAWCLHPAATFHNPENKSYYAAGMKNFFRLMRILAPGLSDKTKYNRKRRR